MNTSFAFVSIISPKEKIFKHNLGAQNIIWGQYTRLPNYLPEKMNLIPLEKAYGNKDL
jgi:hypothetical protein